VCRLYEDLELVRGLLRAGAAPLDAAHDTVVAAVAAAAAPRLRLPRRLADVVAYLTTLEAKWLQVRWSSRGTQT
jgi:hypothetical protein